jgi:hypothetical protein
MENYLFCNRIIKSNIQLTELINGRASSTGKPMLFVLENPIDQLDELIWKHDWTTNGIITINYGMQAADHILHFPGLADFKISADTYEIHCRPLTGIPEFTIRHLLLDQVIPRCIAHQGDLILHASAVKTPKGLILFSGSSGAGKSTLAGYFHQSGYSAISDDCILIEEKGNFVNAIPSYGGVRLWKDSQEFLFPNSKDTVDMAHYSSKQRITLIEGNEFETNKLAAVVFLTSSGEEKKAGVTLKSFPVRDGFMNLLKQTYQLDVTDAKKVAQSVQTLGRVVNKIPLFQLTALRNYDYLPIARDIIIEKLLAKP